MNTPQPDKNGMYPAISGDDPHRITPDVQPDSSEVESEFEMRLRDYFTDGEYQKKIADNLLSLHQSLIREARREELDATLAEFKSEYECVSKEIGTKYQGSPNTMYHVIVRDRIKALTDTNSGGPDD